VQVGKADSVCGSVLSEGQGLGWFTSHLDPHSVESGVVSVPEYSAVLKDGAGMGTRQGTWVSDPGKSTDSQLVQGEEEGETSFPSS